MPSVSHRRCRATRPLEGIRRARVGKDGIDGKTPRILQRGSDFYRQGAVPDNNRRAVPLRGTSARFADNNIQLEMVLSLLAPGKRFRQL
jgi:hypothetical protein